MVISDGALVKEVLQQAIPNALACLGLVLVGFVTVLFVSHTDDAATLGGVGMGSMLFNILGLSLGLGVTSALDTFVSQSNGAGQYKQSGIFLQRAIVVASCVCLPASVALFNSEALLLWFKQEPSVAANAGAYVRGAIFSMWPMYLTNALGSFLRAQKLPSATMYVTWLSNAFHIFSCYLFVIHLRMGAMGAGLAFSATQCFSCVALFGYVQLMRPGVTSYSWIGWNWTQATSDLGEYIGLALPCAMLMWAEWWCAEVMTLLAGLLGVAALASHTAVLQCFILIYMTSGGISAAAAALVGNAIGACDAELARRCARVASLVMLVVAIVIDTALYFNADKIANQFTNQTEVHDSIISLLNILLFVVPLDCVQTVIDGILRGLGKQAVAFKIKLICMWGVRFPLAFYLGVHTKLGIDGVWWGSAAGLGATMAVYLPLLLRVDWESEATSTPYHKLDDDENTPQVFTPVPGFCRSPAHVLTPSASPLLQTASPFGSRVTSPFASRMESPSGHIDFKLP